MRILAIDSSGLVASVALLEEEKLVALYTVNYKKTHSQTLLPMIDEIVKMTETNLDSLDAIAISKGPGSFTGLRIGSATAKGLGLALDKPIISVPTVDALAYNLQECDKIICPIMDAKRNQVYTGLYSFEQGKFNVLLEQIPISIEEIVDKVNSLGKQVVFLGDGVGVYKDVISATVNVPYSFAPFMDRLQNAAALGTLAIEYFKNGKIESAMDQKPEYLRLSQAEREFLEKQHKEA